MNKITKDSCVTLVELPPTQFGVLDGEISYDMYSRVKLPARGIPSLDAVLRREGWKNLQSICSLDGENGKLSSENFGRIYDSDVLGISSITRTVPQSLQLAKEYKLRNPDGIVIVGGPDPTFRAEDWLEEVDIVVRGEGERTISELIERLALDGYDPENPNLGDIDGLAFKRRGGIEVTTPRKLLTSEELSQLPHPFYSPRVRKSIDAGVVETSRGCPNDCDFCTVTEFYGGKFRNKSTDYVIEELMQTRDMGRFLFFTDDNFIGVPRQATNLLEAIVGNGLNKKGGVQTTVKLAERPDLMALLQKAGINLLCVGIESINDATLKGYGKPYTAQQNMQAIKTLKKAGFWIHGMMMLGGEGDTPETLKETSRWLSRNLDTVQLFAATPIPGSRLFDKVEKEGRILTKDLYLYDGQHVVTRPRNFTPFELQKTIFEMYEDFYGVGNTLRRLRNSPDKVLTLEISAYIKTLGRKMLYNPQSKKHLEFLKSIR